MIFLYFVLYFNCCYHATYHFYQVYSLYQAMCCLIATYCETSKMQCYPYVSSMTLLEWYISPVSKHKIQIYCFFNIARCNVMNNYMIATFYLNSQLVRIISLFINYFIIKKKFDLHLLNKQYYLSLNIFPCFSNLISFSSFLVTGNSSTILYQAWRWTSHKIIYKMRLCTSI